MLRSVVLALVGLVSIGCGGDDGFDGRADADPNQPDASDVIDAAPAADGAINAEGPTITVLDPTQPAANDFSSDAIVTEDRITVVCLVEANPAGDPVDSSSVTVDVVSGSDTISQTAQPTTRQDEYEADVNLGGFGNGELMVRCTASDTSAGGRTNSATITTALDLGPSITFVSPVSGSNHANQLDVVFSVTADPVAANDTGADVNLAGVVLTVAGVSIPSLSCDSSGVCTAVVPFDDPTLFVPELDGAQTLTVSAPNTRSTVATVRVDSVVFIADSAGPTIVVNAPVPGELVAGIVDITATVTDPAGVEPASVVATIAGTNEVSLDPVAGDDFAGSFDTRELGLGLVFPTIIVRAQDSVGNQSAVGFVVALDNVPPVAILAGPDVREGKIVDGVLECSDSFDPLGGDQVKDGQTAPQLSEIRARIEDFGNSAPSTGIVIPIAGVNDLTTQVFVLDNAADALVVDTDGDGVCDDINPLLEPTSVPLASDEAAVIDLVSIEEAGSSFFSANAAPFGAGEEGLCSVAADPALDPPEPVCVLTSPGTRIIRTELGAPTIYGIPPVDDISCWGNAFDSVATNIADGYACLALRAEDNLGNVGVSSPIGVCFDADIGSPGDGDCAVSVGNIDANPPPDCTGVYDPSTDTIVPGSSCTPPPPFPNGEVILIE